ncbi:MAG: RNA 2'-phosphotransferase [Desulfurococcales archaeon]|nr:RNA 2'-phosphotransferase [Desulfurococcales archaeon]
MTTSRSKEPPSIYKCKDGVYVESPGECRDIQDVLHASKRVILSKKLAGILRHYPHRYGISLTREGWARISDILKALRKTPGFEWVEYWHIEAIAHLDPKGRYEVKNGFIRARYGHSIDVDVKPDYSVKPPRILYHGTSRGNVDKILAEGIKPMKRKMVHLTSSLDDAIETGKRHGRRISIIIVDVECLESKGLIVGKAGKTVYVVKYVPPECINKVKHL